MPEGNLTADQIKTVPYEPRFPNVNKAKHCYWYYNEWQFCKASKGEDDQQCKQLHRFARSICPDEWVEAWNDQMENGTFPGPAGTLKKE